MATKAAQGKGGTGRFTQDEKRRDSDHVSFLKHRGFRWLWIALALNGAAAAGYLMIDQQPRPNGGTWYGYTLGTIGVGLILWLSLLGVRKRRINPGAWSLKAWTSAHVYLGLSLVVVGTLHTGFQIGWNVHTLAYVLMLLVIATGIYGVVVYATLPASLSANRKEMTRAQMLDVAVRAQRGDHDRHEDQRRSDQAIQPIGIAVELAVGDGRCDKGREDQGEIGHRHDAADCDGTVLAGGGRLALWGERAVAVCRVPALVVARRGVPRRGGG